jgi:hypothetical protein
VLTLTNLPSWLTDLDFLTLRYSVTNDSMPFGGEKDSFIRMEVRGEPRAVRSVRLKAFTSWVGNTSQQDFVPRKVYCVSNVTFHAESKYAIKIFPSPTVFVQWHLLLLIFLNFSYFLQ